MEKEYDSDTTRSPESESYALPRPELVFPGPDPPDCHGGARRSTVTVVARQSHREGYLNVTCVQCENGKSISPVDIAQPTMAHDADADSDPARPPDGNHPSVLLRLCYCGVLRAGATPAMLWRTRFPMTRSEATMEQQMGAARTTRRSRRSGPAEERAQPAEGRSRRAGGAECWRSTHLSDDGGDTPCASGHCMCDLHMHMYRYDRAEGVLTLFRSIRLQRCR